MRFERIPYGVKDFKRIRLEDLYYVDKTAFIRTMEGRANFLCYEFKGRERVRLEEVLT